MYDIYEWLYPPNRSFGWNGLRSLYTEFKIFQIFILLHIYPSILVLQQYTVDHATLTVHVQWYEILFSTTRASTLKMFPPSRMWTWISPSPAPSPPRFIDWFLVKKLRELFLLSYRQVSDLPVASRAGLLTETIIYQGDDCSSLVAHLAAVAATRVQILASCQILYIK